MKLTIVRAIPNGWWFTLRCPGHTPRAWETPTLWQGVQCLGRHFCKQLADRRPRK